MLHLETKNSRNFPTSQEQKVGNIPFATEIGKSDKSDMAKSTKNPLADRIQRRLGDLNLGPVEAALRIPDLERNFLRDLLEGKKQSFSQAKAPLVAKALDWTVDELNGAHVTTKAGRPGKIIPVPLLDSVTAGKLASPASQIPVEHVHKLTFADLGSGEFFALGVDGTSMNRISPEGSVIVVNRRDKQLINGKAYVFSVRGETTYKLWQGGKHPYLAPYSTDESHKPIFIERKRDLEVIGRVKRTVLDL